MGLNRHHDAAIETNVAIVLTDLRRLKGVKQSSVALHVGVTDAAVAQWESGATFPQSWSRWILWADALGKKLTIRLEA